MLKKTIKYTDYNDNVREEDFYFNLNKAELTEMRMSFDGGLEQTIVKIIKAQDMPKIIELFKEIILKAYGEKSDDGKRFIKVASDGHRLADDFAQTEAYSELFMQLASDEKVAADFINGIVPKDVEVSAEEQAKLQRELFGVQSPSEETQAIENKSE